MFIVVPSFFAARYETPCLMRNEIRLHTLPVPALPPKKKEIETVEYN